MSYNARARKSKQNDSRRVKKPKVSTNYELSGIPLNRETKVILPNQEKVRRNTGEITGPVCFEEWDLNKDGVLDSRDVSQWYGIDKRWGAMLSQLVISRMLPKKCNEIRKEFLSSYNIKTKSINTIKNNPVQKRSTLIQQFNDKKRKR